MANTRRTTVVLPVALMENMKIAQAREGKTFGEIAAREIHLFLKGQGLQPDRSPRGITVKY